MAELKEVRNDSASSFVLHTLKFPAPPVLFISKCACKHTEKPVWQSPESVVFGTYEQACAARMLLRASLGIVQMVAWRPLIYPACLPTHTLRVCSPFPPTFIAPSTLQTCPFALCFHLMCLAQTSALNHTKRPQLYSTSKSYTFCITVNGPIFT